MKIIVTTFFALLASPTLAATANLALVDTVVKNELNILASVATDTSDNIEILTEVTPPKTLFGPTDAAFQ